MPLLFQQQEKTNKIYDTMKKKLPTNSEIKVFFFFFGYYFAIFAIIMIDFFPDSILYYISLFFFLIIVGDYESGCVPKKKLHTFTQYTGNMPNSNDYITDDTKTHTHT